MRKSIKAIITLILILFILGVTTFLLLFKWVLNTPVNRSSGEKVVFEIKNGQSTFQISEKLKSRGLIRSDWAFFLNAAMKGKPLMPGVYELSSNMTILKIFETVSQGETQLLKVTIPEGWRTEQIGQLLDKDKIATYQGFVDAAKGYEGKLFPDTYYFSPDNSVQEVVQTMLKNYETRTAGQIVTNEDLIIASIVEREAIKDEERPLIAGIYKNRIKRNMKLEADPTVKYALDNQVISGLSRQELKGFDFWRQKVILTDVKKIDSPYNTYAVTGLPPSPICNPGIKSIESTINYQHHNFLYFLQDKNGGIYPSETLEGQDLNRAKVLGAKLK